ncbi:hypothetical protein N7456_013222 [Penicillium angulare]|uniref:Major facilitator superfamily (MFS) profile domain-containing protein n=1 Tax=Penicillium angulare TaxID=116970 RepID=A0A9W9ELA7_9EURO|nr:hypothetical protein N7456_013222 [Penicillium angulare]
MNFQGVLKHRSRLRVNNNSTTSAVTLTIRQSLWPLSLGFAAGLLDTLNKHFQNTLHINRGRSSALQAAYYGTITRHNEPSHLPLENHSAYPLASLGYANWILRRFGYKAVFIFGLSLYGVGALCMWPAGLYQSFGGFCGATFVIGSGLGSLETAANPYLTVCGPPRYSEIRINLAQSFNAIGATLGPVLGSFVFFTGSNDNVAALQRVQWVYLAIGIFVFCLAAVFFFSDIPEITDEDMEFQVSTTHLNEQKKSIWRQWKLFHAVLAQFTYTGAQGKPLQYFFGFKVRECVSVDLFIVAVASYFINYAVDTWPGTSSRKGAKLLAGAQGTFAIGRFLGSGIMKYIKPRYVFITYLSCCVVFLAASVAERDQRGIALLFVTFFFESVCFPTIVALGIRGLGRYHKRGSGFIVGGVCGGAIVPPIMGHVADIRNDTGFAMLVPTLFMLVAWTYAVAVNFAPSYRDTVDKVGQSTIGLQGEGIEAGERSIGQEEKSKSQI